MAENSTSTPIDDFYLEFYSPEDRNPISEAIAQHVKDESIPASVYIQLASIGSRVVDPKEPAVCLQYNIAKDIAEHGNNPELMRDETLNLLTSGLPDAIIDWGMNQNRKVYTAFDPMYYRLGNLVLVIHEMRQEEGIAYTEKPEWRDPYDNDPEKKVCFNVAQALWRAIINRIHPEWLNSPADYYEPAISFGQVYYPRERTMRRRNVGFSAINDATMCAVYEESTNTKIKGFANRGQQSIRRLLAEEHPELYEQESISEFKAKSSVGGVLRFAGLIVDTK